MTPRGQAGFTLLEVLVTIVVLGMIMLGLAQGTRFGLDAWRLQSRQIAARDEFGAAERLIRSLIARAEPAAEDAPPRLRGMPAALLLWTRLPQMAEAAGFGAVEAALGVDAAHHLVLRAAAHPGAVALRPSSPVIEEHLLDDIDHLELSYWQPQDARRPGAWRRDWAASELPALIRVRIVFLAATGQHWPDIVEAPRRAPPRR